MSFTVFGIVNPNADAVQIIEQELAKIILMVKEHEPGNILYDVFRQANIEDGKQTFIIHQKLADEAAWEKHLNAPYSQRLSKKIADEGLCSERGMEIKVGGKPFLSK